MMLREMTDVLRSIESRLASFRENQNGLLQDRQTSFFQNALKSDSIIGHTRECIRSSLAQLDELSLLLQRVSHHLAEANALLQSLSTSLYAQPEKSHRLETLLRQALIEEPRMNQTLAPVSNNENRQEQRERLSLLDTLSFMEHSITDVRDRMLTVSNLWLHNDELIVQIERLFLRAEHDKRLQKNTSEQWVRQLADVRSLMRSDPIAAKAQLDAYQNLLQSPESSNQPNVSVTESPERPVQLVENIQQEKSREVEAAPVFSQVVEKLIEQKNELFFNLRQARVRSAIARAMLFEQLSQEEKPLPVGVDDATYYGLLDWDADIRARLSASGLHIALERIAELLRELIVLEQGVVKEVLARLDVRTELIGRFRARKEQLFKLRALGAQASTDMDAQVTRVERLLVLRPTPLAELRFSIDLFSVAVAELDKRIRFNK